MTKEIYGGSEKVKEVLRKIENDIKVTDKQIEGFLAAHNICQFDGNGLCLLFEKAFDKIRELKEERGDKVNYIKTRTVTKWRVEVVYHFELEEALNGLVEEGWHIWPQLIQQLQVQEGRFIIIVSQDVEQEVEVI